MRRKRNMGLEIVVLLLILCILPLGTSWARGRRGGNSGGEITAAFVGGAAMPLSGYMGGPSACYSMAASNVVNLGLQAGDVDPHTAALISSAAGGLAGGISSGNIVGSLAGNLASTEINYQMQKHDINPFLAGIASSTIGSGISSGIDKGFTEGFKSMASLENLRKTVINQGVSYGVSQAVDGIVDKYSPARAYTGSIGSVAGTVANNGVDRFLNIKHYVPDQRASEKYSLENMKDLPQEVQSGLKIAEEFGLLEGKKAQAWWDKDKVLDETNYALSKEFRVLSPMDVVELRNLKHKAVKDDDVGQIEVKVGEINNGQFRVEPWYKARLDSQNKIVNYDPKKREIQEYGEWDAPAVLGIFQAAPPTNAIRVNPKTGSMYQNSFIPTPASQTQSQPNITPKTYTPLN